jgi:hypothetical protein
LRQIVSQIDLVAPTEASLLIQGETGTGKEFVAHEIHRRSRRKERPFIRVNCASIPGDLFESEFFGHSKGAFTGALKDRAGRFETAEGEQEVPLTQRANRNKNRPIIAPQVERCEFPPTPGHPAEQRGKARSILRRKNKSVLRFGSEFVHALRIDPRCADQ